MGDFCLLQLTVSKVCYFNVKKSNQGPMRGEKGQKKWKKKQKIVISQKFRNTANAT